MVEDDKPSFFLMGAQRNDWCLLDEANFQEFFRNSDPLVIYVLYPETPCVLRIQTYNLAVFGLHPNWDKRVHMLAEEITRISADVIGIQEARHDPFYGSGPIQRKISGFLSSVSDKKPSGRHMLDDLLSLVPQYPYYYWQPAMNYKDGIVEGIAVLSRFPISDIEFVKLTKSKGDGNRRVCLKATVKHPRNELQFFNTHMTYSVNGQVKQSEEIIKFMDSQNQGSPQVLVGDLNIKNKFENPGLLLATQLVDVWKLLNSEDPGFTFPSWGPKERYDRILVRNLPGVLECGISGFAENKKQWPSDHCTLFADFLIAT